MEHIETYVGQQYDPVVLETIESMQVISISKPMDVSAPDDTMADVEKLL